MSTVRKDTLKDFYLTVNFSHAQEEVMLKRLLDQANQFYLKAENVKAYEAWLAERKKDK